MRVEERVIPARDGFRLAATVFGEQASGTDTVVVAPATGAPRGFYGAFARFLADAGYTVVSFDYRGIAGSAPLTLRGFSATMRDWGEQDLAGVLDWTRTTLRPRRLLLVGNSVGGQLLGITPGAETLDAALLVAAQNGYWGRWPPRYKPRMLAFWYLLQPLTTTTLGYLPGWTYGGKHLPAGVAWDWARWCRHPEYICRLGAHVCEGFARLRYPVRFYSFTDDLFAPAGTVEALMRYFTAARAEHVRLRPADVDAARVGHFGFFRPAVQNTLWRDALAWLEAPDGAGTAVAHAPV